VIEQGASLRVAPGGGRLTRRARALLFVPAGDDARLRAAFLAHPDGAELGSVGAAVVEAGFDVPAFVALAWGPHLRAMAFGEIDIETDQPTMPMLSGAGSRTWVEHTTAQPTAATVEVNAEGVDASTDLEIGTVPAGGFRLELGRSEGVAAVAAADVVELVELVEVGEVGEVGDVPTELQAAVDADVTLPPIDTESLLPPEVDVARRDAFVEARQCSSGHASAPTAAACEVCGELLPPGQAAVVSVRRPSLGRLQLDDGGELELDEGLLIGRNPARDTDPERASLRRVHVEGEKVSRSHVAVRLQGWEVLVADCGSTNGTFVVPHPGAQVVTLAPDQPQLVEPDAVVYFGSRSFVVHGRKKEP
jgi:hypothetical protein